MLTDSRNISDQGELVLAQADQLRRHIEKHECAKCLAIYAAFLKAITEWVNRPSQSENKKEGGFL